MVPTPNPNVGINQKGTRVRQEWERVEGKTPIQFGTKEAVGYKQKTSIDHKRLKINKNQSYLELLREKTDLGPKVKYVQALHSAENPYFSYFLWAMLVFGVIIETCLYTFSAMPAGLSFGMNVQKYYFSSRSWLDLETRTSQLANLPVLMKVNEATHGYFNVHSKKHDNTNSFWENPFFKNDRAALQPVCNPSFTLARALDTSEGEHKVSADFMDNYFNASAENGGNDYWWDMRRIDFAIGDGVVGLYDIDSTATELTFDAWLEYRKCLVQGAYEIDFSSSNVKTLKKQGLISSDILPSSKYSSFDGFSSPLKIPQKTWYLHDTNTSMDISENFRDDIINLDQVLTCTVATPQTLSKTILENFGLGFDSNVPCEDYDNPDLCKCQYQPHITEVVSAIDNLQKLTHSGDKQLVRTAKSEWFSSKAFYQYLLTTVLPILLFMPGLYFPPPKMVNRTVMTLLMRIIAIYNIYNLQLSFLNPLFKTSKDFCFKKREHNTVEVDETGNFDFSRLPDESLHLLQKIFPGFECTCAPGTVFIVCKIILNWLYLFTR
jgi:hypothetical protein